MTRRLVAKELFEHWRLLLAVVALEAVGLGVLLARSQIGNDAISAIYALEQQLLTVCPLGASVVLQALVARELRTKTILFLETIPISRWQAIAAKLTVAFVIVFGCALAALAVVLAVARRSELVDARFVGILALKTLVISALTFAITFVAAALGRYRWPFYAALFVLAFVYDEAGGDLDRVPPVSLLGDEFATERFAMPTTDLLLVAAASAAIIAFGLSLLLARGGSVAILLGERMSHREKVMVAGVLLSSLMATYVLTDDERKPPYEINDRAAVRSLGTQLNLTVLPPPSPRIAPQLLGDSLHASLEPLAAVLDSGKLPPIFFIHRRDLDLHRFETASAHARDGLVVRANLAGDRVAMRDLVAFTTGALIDQITDDRSRTEDRRWLRDGFAEHWAAERWSHGGEADREQLWLRALYARRAGFEPEDVRRWFTVHDALGEPIAAAFAWSGLVELEEALGTARMHRLLRSALEPGSADGLRGLIRARSRRFDALLAPDLEPEAFFERWRSRLEREESRLTNRLAAIPRYEARSSTLGEKQSRTVVLTASADPPLDVPASVSLLWRRLPAIDGPLSQFELAREDQSFARETTLAIPAPFLPGSRVFLAAAVFSSELGCEVRFGAQRRTVE